VVEAQPPLAPCADGELRGRPTHAHSSSKQHQAGCGCTANPAGQHTHARPRAVVSCGDGRVGGDGQGAALLLHTGACRVAATEEASQQQLRH